MKNISELSMFGDIYDIDMSVMQMENVASDLVFLLKHSGLSRSNLANKLGWNKSRVTKVLSGDENLTIKTITSVAESLGYGFDVVFYNEKYEQPKQPWHIDKLTKALITESVESKQHMAFKVQGSNEVFNDLMAGKDADYYISFNNSPNDNTAILKQSTKNIPSRKMSFHYDLPISITQSFVSGVEGIKSNG